MTQELVVRADNLLQNLRQLFKELKELRCKLAPWLEGYNSLQGFENHAKAWEKGDKYCTSLDISMEWRVKEWKKWRAQKKE